MSSFEMVNNLKSEELSHKILQLSVLYLKINQCVSEAQKFYSFFSCLFTIYKLHKPLKRIWFYQTRVQNSKMYRFKVVAIKLANINLGHPVCNMYYLKL